MVKVLYRSTGGRPQQGLWHEPGTAPAAAGGEAGPAGGIPGDAPDLPADTGTYTFDWGPFSFKRKPGDRRSLYWVPVSAELTVGATFALDISAKLTAMPVGVVLEWSPKLPSDNLVAGAAIGLAALSTIATAGLAVADAIAAGRPASAAGDADRARNLDAAYKHTALVATAIDLILAQKEISFEARMPLQVDLTWHPFVVITRMAGMWHCAPLESKTALFKYESGRDKTNAALGIVDSTTIRQALVGAPKAAIGTVLQVAGLKNSS